MGEKKAAVILSTLCLWLGGKKEGKVDASVDSLCEEKPPSVGAPAWRWFQKKKENSVAGFEITIRRGFLPISAGKGKKGANAQILGALSFQKRRFGSFFPSQRRRGHPWGNKV